jgi:two-component system, LytTR family, sensor kinase
MDQAHRVRPRLIFAVFTLLGLFSSLQASLVTNLFAERARPFAVPLILNMGYWYAWALLVPVVLWIARRFPFERGRWRRSAPVHLVAVGLVTFAHTVLTTSIDFQVMTWVPPHSKTPIPPWWSAVLRSYVWQFDWNMATYWALVAFQHAATYQREAQIRSLRASQLESRLAEARLEALQRQLHPHFLFNTLNAISALMHRDVEAADEMLARLSDLLRMALDQRGVQEVPLKDELEFVEKYLEIEQARFGNRLSVQVDVGSETLDALVPNLVLQPLVENCIRHAVSTSIEPRQVAIKAHRIADTLQLQVCDDGPGLPGNPPGKGVGLANTRSRLEQLYGPQQRMQFSKPAAASGLIVTIELPFHLEQSQDLSQAVEGVA